MTSNAGVQGKPVAEKVDNLDPSTPIDLAATRKWQRPEVEAAVHAVRDRENERGAEAESIMWNAAAAMGRARDLDLISGKDGAWATQGDYAAACGYAKATGTLLARLATVQAQGVRFGTVEWTFVVKHGTNARVGAAIKSVEPGKGALGKIREALKPLRAEAEANGGKVAGSKREPGKPAAEKQEEVKASEATADDILHLLHGLRVAVHDMSNEDAHRVLDGMRAFVKAESHRRELLTKAGKDPKPEAPKVEAAA